MSNRGSVIDAGAFLRRTHIQGGIALRSRLTNFVTALTIGLLATQDALACTRVLWQAPDGQVLVGRTQDWTEKAGHAFRVFPRGIEREGAVAENPVKWTSKYAHTKASTRWA
jgi:choloylglycine hydrolase